MGICIYIYIYILIMMACAQLILSIPEGASTDFTVFCDVRSNFIPNSYVLVEPGHFYNLWAKSPQHRAACKAPYSRTLIGP